MENENRQGTGHAQESDPVQPQASGTKQEWKLESMKKPEKKSRLAMEVLEWLLYIVGAFLLASLIQSEVFALTEVNMSSMESTLIPEDKLLMNKLAYRFNEPERGDMIIFLKDESAFGFTGRMEVYLTDVKMKLQGEFRRNRLIKRVIATAGDTVEIRDDVVLLNGEVLNEPYARVDPDSGRVLNGNLASVTVPERQIFVMGDNRGRSLDSRNFGFVEISSVEGKAVFRILPLSSFGNPYEVRSSSVGNPE